MLLAADTDTLTGHDIASEATWADKYRDSNRDTTKVRYEGTRLWHFVDIKLAEPNLASACFGHPPLPPGVPASKGAPRTCVVDKIIASRPSLAIRPLLPRGPCRTYRLSIGLAARQMSISGITCTLRVAKLLARILEFDVIVRTGASPPALQDRNETRNIAGASGNSA
jgi:hypothetical protein